MPRSGSGTYTLPSGNPVVTGTTIESNWANTTLSDIATTLSDSLSRSGQGGMTAALRVADGTQGAPGVGFANETGSGFYRAGTGEVWAVVQGAQTLNLDANGVTVPSDKATSIEGTFVFNETGADKDARFEGDTDANLLFLDASTDRVGVGTSTPDAKLTVNGVGAFGDGAVGTPSISNTGDLNTGIWFPAADTVAVSTGGAEVARFDSSGNLGLGVTPSAWGSGAKSLEGIGGALTFFDSTNDQLWLTQNAYWDGSWKYKTTNYATSFQQYLGSHVWFTAPSGTAGNTISFTQAMTLDASGNLGVGTTSPQRQIETYVAAGGNALQARSSAVTIDAGINSSNDGGFLYTRTNHFLAFGTNNAERARITSGGEFQSYGAVSIWPSSSGGAGSYSIKRAATNALAIIDDFAGQERLRITSGGDLLVAKTNNTVSNVGHVALSDGSYYSTMAASANTTTTLHAYSTGAAAYRFYVGLGGTVYATSTTITAISDQRLKENIQDLDVGLDKIIALKPRKFDWKAGKGKDIKGDRGFIAQEFEQVFPDLIDEWKDPAPEGEEPYKAVRADLIPVLVKAIQEQQALITALTARVAALEAQP